MTEPETPVEDAPAEPETQPEPAAEDSTDAEPEAGTDDLDDFSG